jgi:hypothetical protein
MTCAGMDESVWQNRSYSELTADDVREYLDCVPRTGSAPALWKFLW